MKWLIVILLAVSAPLAFAQGQINPSLLIDTVEIPADEFNTVLREAPVRQIDRIHAVSWQVTLDNNLNFANPNGISVFRIYDAESIDEFIEVGMGAQPNYKFWVAVQTPKEGYVVIHRDFERGWYPQTKSIISYTDRAGLTVNNGARIVVTNLDIGVFAIASYSVHGLESSTDPPSVNSGSMIVEFLSGDPAKNIFSLYPFYIAAAVGAIVGFLFITKKRT
ncbi:MAG: hypothetical protein D9C04_05400 [Nitrosopumilus sp. B06]|nr:MAG: hypothetical protein EB828_06425 [Nitrosopumilus sp. D6]RNJ79251.1 MAG: hypothetical protein D9C04_05400 [Nitrosopumilus sp. B06]